MIFHDIKPVSSLHILAIPRLCHITFAQDLSLEMKNRFVENLLTAARNYLNLENLDKGDLLIGFHKGFWTSVKHAHIHLIYRGFLDLIDELH